MLGMLPDFGAPVTFFLNADYRERVPIKVPLTAKQITRMNRDVAFALRHCKQKASNRRISIAQEIEQSASRRPQTKTRLPPSKHPSLRNAIVRLPSMPLSR